MFMVGKENKMSLSGLIDIKFLQEFQDMFAKTFNLASITVDNTGPITKPSNFTDFCIKYTRGNALGLRKCIDCDIQYGKIAAQTGKPVIYNCHTGLTDFAVPIVVDGEHIGSILGGQVLTSPPDEKHFRKIARELGINEDEYIDAVKKIKIVPAESIKAAADLLYSVANAISEISFRNLELIKHSEREKADSKIIETILKSLNIEETLSFICEETAKIFNVQRSTISVFPNPQNYEDCIVKKEYKSDENINGVNNLEEFKKIAAFWGSELLNKDGVLAIENIQESNIPEYFKNCYKHIGIKSIIGTSIKKDDDAWGILILSEYNDYRKWTDDDINLLKTISNQTYIAIKQAELLVTTKKQAQREVLLRKITETIRSSLNINETLTYICDELAQLFKVQRATIIEYPEKDDYAKFVVRREYKSHKEIKGILNNPSFNWKVGKIWAKALKGDCESLAVDNIKESDMPDFFKKNYESIGQKSIAIVPIKKDEDKWGVIILSEYNYCRHWTRDEINLLRTISDQIYIAIKQAELYNTVQRTAENEKVLRRIMSSSTKTFDIHEVINSIVTETGKLFNADRCIFVEYDFENESDKLIMNYAEYTSSKDICTHASNIPSPKIIKAIIELLKQRKILIAEDVAKEKLMDETKHLLIDKLSVKSFLVVPVYFGEINYGSINLHYVQDYKQFSQDTINMVTTIANQSAAVIHRAKLYSKIEKNEKYTRAVLDSIKDGIITIDDDFIIESCNPAVETIWGYSPKECIGGKLDLLLEHDCRDKDKKTCLSQNVVNGIRKNEEKFPVEVNVSEVILENKKVHILVVRDITERKRIEKMKSEFVSTVSHELRTPLTSIKGSLGLVTSGVLGALPEKVSKLVDVANNNCTRLTNLINDILDLEKIKAGKYEFKYEEIGINSIIDQSTTLNQSYAEQFGMRIKVIKPTEEAFIKADKNRLLQVISNLFSNAVKFSNLDGEVTIKIETKNDKVKVSFIDNGIGIPDDAKHKIFQSFSQVDSSDTRSKGGTGLGLSICKLIIESMGGEINFESKLGKGSTFFFIMPAIAQGSLKTEDGQIKELGPDEDAW